MGGSEPRRIGSAESAAEFSDCHGWWNDSCCWDLFVVQRGVLLCVAVCERGEFAACGVGRGADFCGKRRGAMVHTSDDCFGAWNAEFVAAQRGARALRDGARRSVLSRHVERASEIPDA